MAKNLTLYMETTKKSPEQTVGEIQALLKQLNIREVLINYDDDGEIEALSFSIRKGGSKIPFRLPVNHKPLWELAQNGQTKYIKTEEQARKVAWRQIYRWIEAQLALIQVGMAEAEEVFLPYMLIDNQHTVYDKFLSQGIAGYLAEGSK